jgi:hypothetical protein
MADAMQRMRLRQKGGCAETCTLDEVKPEMLVKPRPPGRAHRVARLQNAAQPRAGPAAH